MSAERAYFYGGVTTISDSVGVTDSREGQYKILFSRKVSDSLVAGDDTSRIIPFKPGRKIVAYDQEFDLQNAENGRLNPDLVRRNLETLIGERKNALLSTVKYEIKDDVIYGENMEESFLGIIKKGIKHRRENGNSVDWERENAEAQGFQKIQYFLGRQDAPIGSMMLSISPRSESRDSIYKHNFYDIYTLKQEKGQKFIEMRRYSSALKIPEYLKRLKQVIPDVNIFPNAASFLANPIRIEKNSDSGLQDADSIHKLLHEDHEYMPPEEFGKLLADRNLQGMIRRYIEALIKGDKSNLKLIFNAILNQADEARTWKEVENEIKRGRIEMDKVDFDDPMFRSRLNDRIFVLGNQPVKQVAAACGPSGESTLDLGINSGLNLGSAFSVSEFGTEKDEYGSRVFECPECHNKVTRPLHKLVPRCPHCSSDKVAC